MRCKSQIADGMMLRLGAWVSARSLLLSGSYFGLQKFVLDERSVQNCRNRVPRRHCSKRLRMKFWNRCIDRFDVIKSAESELLLEIWPR